MTYDDLEQQMHLRFQSTLPRGERLASRRAGASEDGMHKANRDRMRELYDRFIAFCTANPSCQLPRERICEALVDEPAPRFYIDLQMAMKVIQRERLRHRQELINRINR